MEMGGAERALVNVINLLEKYYDIDLILLEKKGELLKDLPKSINIYEVGKKSLSYILFRFVPLYRKYKINKLTKEKYSLACAFMEGRAATWLVDMKQKCHKIAWIHNDVKEFNIGISEREIKKTYSKLDKVYIVSKHSQDSFCEKYNIDFKNTEVIYNLIDEEGILKKASLLNVPKDKFTFINVSKMRKQKRHDRLLKCAYNLKEMGYDFNLWLVGSGPLEEEVKSLIKELGLENTVKLWGLQENPYPYIKAANYFVMSSDHEGYPLSLLESLLLKTPVVTTDVSGAKEIIKDNKYGLICEINEEALTKAMQEVLDNPHKEIIDNLKKYQGNNKEIINQLLKISRVNH